MKEHGHEQVHTGQSIGPAHASEQAVHPVCGMTVNRQTAAPSSEYEGATYFFCSPHCLETFRKDPIRFVKSPALGASPQAKPISIAKSE